MKKIFLLCLFGLVVGIVLISYHLAMTSHKRTSIKTQDSISLNSSKPTQQVLAAETTPFPTIVPTPTPSQKPTTILKKQKISFGVVVDDKAIGSGTITNLEQTLNHPLNFLSIYKQFGLEDRSLNEADLNYAKKNGKSLLIAWEPWDPEQGMNQSKDYLKSIISGEQDNYIHSFASQIKSFGNPAEIRFGHEMNCNWYPWCNRPTDYISAYRHIVDLFRRDNVENVSWMWCINANNVPYSPISNVSQYYPGDNYVDDIGIDGFNFGGSQWQTFSSIFTPAYNFVTTTYHKKISISETASAEIGGDKADWVNNMFNVLPGSFPAVYELDWFDLLKETDWRINSTQKSQQAFINNLSK